jgi:hypothetical protein
MLAAYQRQFDRSSCSTSGRLSRQIQKTKASLGSVTPNLIWIAANLPACQKAAVKQPQSAIRTHLETVMEEKDLSNEHAAGGMSPPYNRRLR